MSSVGPVMAQEDMAKMPPFVQRMVNEQQALQENTNKANDFLGNANNMTILQPIPRLLLEEQVVAMSNYSRLLTMRIGYYSVEYRNGT